jgi:hypothetical protein
LLICFIQPTFISFRLDTPTFWRIFVHGFTDVWIFEDIDTSVQPNYWSEKKGSFAKQCPNPNPIDRLYGYQYRSKMLNLRFLLYSVFLFSYSYSIVPTYLLCWAIIWASKDNNTVIYTIYGIYVTLYTHNSKKVWTTGQFYMSQYFNVEWRSYCSFQESLFLFVLFML